MAANRQAAVAREDDDGAVALAGGLERREDAPDLRADPGETKNLSASPRQQPRVAAMLTQLETAQRKYGDRMPLQVSDPKLAVWTPPSGEAMETMIRTNQTR